MPSLLPFVDSLESVAEPLRPYYAERTIEGKKVYVLDAVIRDHPDAQALKRALDAEKEEARIAKEAAKTAEQRAAEIEAAAKKGGKKDDQNGESLDDLMKRFEREKDEAVAKERQAREKAEATLKDRSLSDLLRTAAVKAKMRAERIEDAIRLERDRFKLSDDGKSVIVLDEHGRPDTVSAERFWAENHATMRPEFYEGSGLGGSGAQEGRTTAAGQKVVSADAFMDNLDDIAAGKAVVANP
jgi:hypothetical protein